MQQQHFPKVDEVVRSDAPTRPRASVPITTVEFEMKRQYRAGMQPRFTVKAKVCAREKSASRWRRGLSLGAGSWFGALLEKEFDDGVVLQSLGRVQRRATVGVGRIHIHAEID